MDLSRTIVEISLMALPLMLGVTLHEAGHAYAAWYLGDDTAKRMGRLSLNPLVHVDKVGTIIVPLAMKLLGAPFMFGWAKPVPVDISRLKNPNRDRIFVAIAGPAANLFVALFAAIGLKIAIGFGFDNNDWVVKTLYYGVFLNCLLAVLNMLPIPPLDGGNVAIGLLPSGIAAKFESIAPFGFLIVIGLVMLIPQVLMWPTIFLVKTFLGVIGL